MIICLVIQPWSHCCFLECSVQLLAIGVVGEYLAKTYIEAKDRPMYIIKKHMTKQGEIKDAEVSASNHKTR